MRAPAFYNSKVRNFRVQWAFLYGVPITFTWGKLIGHICITVMTLLLTWTSSYPQQHCLQLRAGDKATTNPNTFVLHLLLLGVHSI
mmetsp:Transcript_6529/g.22996  ORF Transcript_6529/g.22996 Transcript_6529/m.22996 type:complete len:86 (+) Transcript_6529:537-794(+)